VNRAEAAQRLGVSEAKLVEAARGWLAGAMLSPDDLAAAWGVSRWEIYQLIRLGTEHGARLHPERGGLFPTVKLSHKVRRIPLEAVERHLRFMARPRGRVSVEVAA